MKVIPDIKVCWLGQMCNLAIGQYPDKSTAIRLLMRSGEPMATATVSLADYKATPKDPYYVWIKDWSENKGMFSALVNAEIIRDEHQDFHCGFDAYARFGRLIGKAEKHLEKLLASR